jgi:hypothetical protein
VIALTLTGVSLAGSAAAVSPPFTISGQVTSLIGYPAGTAQVAVGYYTAGAWQYSSNVNVGVDGMYSVDATDGPGEYDLYFTVSDNSVPFLSTYFGGSVDEPDGSLSANAGIIDATAGTDIANQAVVLVPAGYITGTVESGGAALAGQDLQAFDPNSPDEYDASAPTDSNGRYSIKVPANDPLAVVSFGSSVYYPQFYDGYFADIAGYTPVTASQGATVANVDFTLNPLNASFAAIVNAEQNQGGSLQPLATGTSHLYVIDEQGNVLQTANASLSGGVHALVASTPGEYEFEFTNTAGQRLAIDNYDFGNGSVVPPNPCVVDPGSLSQDDLNGLPPFPGQLEFTLDPDLSICNAAPSTPTAPTKHHAFVFSGSTTTTVATPTPTPTPTPTETPSASPSPSPSASSTPAPKVAPQGGGLPWWVWLLIIVVGILILAGIAFVLFRRR